MVSRPRGLPVLKAQPLASLVSKPRVSLVSKPRNLKDPLVSRHSSALPWRLLGLRARPKALESLREPYKALKGLLIRLSRAL